MKFFIAVALALASLSSFASVITCSGQTTKAQIVLKVTGSFFALDREEYSYEGKVIKTDGYQFGVKSNLEEKTQCLVYKFRTLKKHKLAKKDADMDLTITQSSESEDPIFFVLKQDNQAELTIKENDVVTLVEKMDCK